MTVFYRVHPSDAPAFNADNAWSAPWGSDTRSTDGSQYQCIACDGTNEGMHDCTHCGGCGFSDAFLTVRCDHCNGDGIIYACGNCDEGWIDCIRGYSCEEEPESLIKYFTERFVTPDEGDQVIIFEGDQTGVGIDSEPTAVPTRVIETLRWDAFITRYQGANA
ncbi:hypothetical protein [Streptomyces sp. NPDC095613]|uniref:hypothetical protein n=1 Tax=Streptomyces sp. NPDC095613 TaxID=3155540 RepID=UPI003331F216